MENFTLQRAQPYYEQIYQSLKELIFQGVYQPGDRIYEAKIAKEFNVSRSPVREAVRALVKEGLLIENNKSQLEVYKPSLTDVQDIYQCRSALESLATKLATQRISNEKLLEIENHLSVTKEAIFNSNNNKQTLITLNAKFHNLIIESSENQRLQKQIKDLRSLTYFYRSMNFKGNNRKQTILDEHKEVFSFIKKRDDVKASELMYKHIENDLAHLKSLLKD